MSNTRLNKRSRGFEVNGIQYLVPFADMLNHQNYAKTKFTRNTKHNTFEMRVEDHYSIGSEVFNNYYPRSNCDLLRLYGFVLNPNEVSINVAMETQLEENEPFIDVKRNLVQKFGLDRLPKEKRLLILIENSTHIMKTIITLPLILFLPN